MDFFDDETSGAPAGSGGTPSAPSSRRRRPDRRRIRNQRVIILALILFIAVFAIAWWARSCQHNRKVGSYETYFKGVATAIHDSDVLGKRVTALMRDPTKLSRKELIAKLDELSSLQAEIATRTAKFEPPGTLEGEQSQLATGMKIRSAGFDLLRAAIMGTLANKKVSVKDITALDPYFSGPDAYYQQLVYVPAQQAMRDDGVSGVAVPTATYYLTWKALDPVVVGAALQNVGKSPKMTGIHGVALIGTTAKTTSGDITLTKGRTNDVPASPDLSFVVQVQNQGSVTERNVPVTATLLLPGGSSIKKSASIAVVEARKTQEVTLTGFAIPTEALSKVITLKIMAGPVKGEAVATNNGATYKLLLQLK